MDLEKLRERFASKFEVDRATGCWLWTASLAGAGYGQIKIPGERRQIYAHRLSFLLHKGEIGAGADICHHCDNPRCVNPDHLFIGTRVENMQDMARKGRGTGGREMPVHRGVRNSQAKITERDVRRIRKLVLAGVSNREIGRIFGLSGVQIGHIASGRHWGHVS